jgi:hypothetical protein
VEAFTKKLDQLENRVRALEASMACSYLPSPPSSPPCLLFSISPHLVSFICSPYWFPATYLSILPPNPTPVTPLPPLPPIMRPAAHSVGTAVRALHVALPPPQHTRALPSPRVCPFALFFIFVFVFAFTFIFAFVFVFCLLFNQFNS